jgi:hypothetical protein
MRSPTYSLVKFFYFSLAIFLNAEGFMALGFFQTPKRALLDPCAIAPNFLKPNIQVN